MLLQYPRSQHQQQDEVECSEATSREKKLKLKMSYVLMASVCNILYAYIRVKEKKYRSYKPKPSMLKSKKQVTLFVNYSYNIFYGLCSPKMYKGNRKLYAKLWNFLFYMGGYIWTYSSTQFNNLPMVNNQLRWCLLNFLVKSHSKLLLWGNVLQHKITARVVSWQLRINLSGPGMLDQMKSIVFTVKLQKSLEQFWPIFDT